MRTLATAVTIVCALGATSFATEAYSSSETLVGWSEDGERYAVIRSSSDDPETSRLEVRERGKVIATFKDGDKGVPESVDDRPGVERIDIEKWAPLQKHGLKKLEAAARKRFKDGFELAKIGKRQDSYHCKDGGWTLKRKGEAKPFHEVKTKDHCFAVLGGYVHKGGTRALVKLTESSWTTSKGGESSSDDDTKFVLVDISAKAL